MAIKTYLYRAAGVTDADLVPLLATGAGATVGSVSCANSLLIVSCIADNKKGCLSRCMSPRETAQLLSCARCWPYCLVTWKSAKLTARLLVRSET